MSVFPCSSSDCPLTAQEREIAPTATIDHPIGPSDDEASQIEQSHSTGIGRDDSVESRYDRCPCQGSTPKEQVCLAMGHAENSLGRCRLRQTPERDDEYVGARWTKVIRSAECNSRSP